MSLILEALRKSEAERRRGEAPGLRVELPPVAASRRPAFPAWAWIAGLAVVLFAMLLVLWPRGSGSDVDGRAPAVAAVAPPTDGPAERVGTDTDATGVGDAFPKVERIAPTPPPPAGTVAVDESAPSEGSASNRPAAPAAAAPRPEPRPGAGIPRITELASAQRQRLPAMKLSMHMWNEDPARRFVVIDGQRKAEGDRVGEAAIVAIDRDGVVLDLDGRQVRVPLP